MSQDLALLPGTLLCLYPAIPKVNIVSMEQMVMTKRNWLNILILGGGFFMLFTAFQTTAFVQSVTIDSFFAPSCNNGSIVNTNETDENKQYIIDAGIPINGAFSKRIGYISLCIIYLMVALGNWVSVPVVAVFGAKWSCAISGALYVVYIVALIRPYVPVIFFGAFVLGSAGGILWTAQGQILIQNSSKDKMSMTSGIFWLMLQCSLIAGNIFFFLYLTLRVGNEKCISRLDNYIIFGIFTALGLGGVALLLLIQPVKKMSKAYFQQKPVNSDSSNDISKTMLTEGTADLPYTSIQFSSAFHEAGKSLVRAFKLLFSLDMFLLSICFIYTGYELNFWSGVYGAIIGHTGIFKRSYIGLAGLFIGLGEIIGGGIFGIFGKYSNKLGKDPIVLLGMLVHYASYLLIFYNLPAESISSDISVEDSFGQVFDTSNVYIAMLCAFLLGFGDACFNTQIYTMIGTLYPSDEQSAPAMALFKFFQSLAAMFGFITTTFILLKWQLLILVVLATLGTLTFAIVEWRHYKPPRPKY